MPELPEVESVRLTLLPHLRARSVRSVEVRRRDVVRVVDPRGKERPLPSRHGTIHLLRGARIMRLERRGKQIALIGKGITGEQVLVVHLGMSGQLLCVAPGAHLPSVSHVHLVWGLDSGARLVFRDPRRFGGVWALPDRRALEERWTSLGPDALTITGDELAARLAGSRRVIKSALLDQSVLAGVGNIYADESLFVARIPPLAVAGELRREATERLAFAIRGVLARAITAGGSSLRGGTYLNADGAPGGYQAAHAVYSRGGKPCLVCSQPLRSMLISSRTTVWCDRCQQLSP